MKTLKQLETAAQESLSAYIKRTYEFEELFNKVLEDLRSAESVIAPMAAVFDASNEMKIKYNLGEGLSPAGVMRELDVLLQRAKDENGNY